MTIRAPQYRLPAQRCPTTCIVHKPRADSVVGVSDHLLRNKFRETLSSLKEELMPSPLHPRRVLNIVGR